MFSYEEYRKIIEIVKESGKGANFKEAKKMDQFIIMRHDVEFSVDRAFELSQVEKSMGFTSTYFFQWTNNSYNILSKRNKDIITKMHKDGHAIGLHFATNGLTDIREIQRRIEHEIFAWNMMLEFNVDTFSVHRPSKEVLSADIRVPDIINAYQDDFFTFADNVTEDTPVKVKYISDAQHHWNYGTPDKETLLGYDKVQILTHPYSWTEYGYDNLHNFQTLIQERTDELINTIDGECKHFAGIKKEIQREYAVYRK
ncbi:MAG: hypothetical protein PHE02_00155 [Lachnospiraceae bacterium]|nr:hypothetical protein [Lachnospiraceae bacterium]